MLQSTGSQRVGYDLATEQEQHCVINWHVCIRNGCSLILRRMLMKVCQGSYMLSTAEYMLNLCNSKIFCQEATSLQEELSDISLKKKKSYPANILDQ